ncbi:MAG: ADP-ribosylglycohydrolase family protein [Prevotella sp.]|nr:ADP-ribosylglycohydrolase family protein [Prevotella sp.]
MKQYQIDRIKDLMDERGITSKELASKCGVSEMTIRRILDPSHNPTTDNVEKVAEALGVHEQYIYETEAESKSKQPINGYIEYGGTISSIKTFKQLEKVYESIKYDMNVPKLAKELRAKDKENKKSQTKTEIDISAIDLRRPEEYDTTKVKTWSFLHTDDVRDGHSINIGNFSSEHGLDLCGEHFLHSESAYIVGLFSNNTQNHINIQRQLQYEKSPNDAKFKVRSKYAKQGYSRTDWDEFKAEWMLYVVWHKCISNNEFAKLLRYIPKDVIIIENTTNQGTGSNLFWGAENKEIEDAHNCIEREVELSNIGMGTNELKKLKSIERNKINNIGVWKGVNCLGKCLNICKHCLETGAEPPIDYDLLKSKNIYLFGKLLTFDDKPKAQKTVIQEPTMPRKARVKVTVVKEKNTSQEVVSKVDSNESNVKGIIGAVIGEVVGSRFEFAKSLPKKRYDLFASQCSFTDDTVLTIAVADALLHGKEFKDTLWEWALRYPHAGFGHSFKQWKKNKKKNIEATNDSKGNGCGMRVSPIGFYAKSLDEALELARQSAIVSHNSVEGIRGAQSIAAATFLAKQQTPKAEIKKYISEQFGYDLDLTDDEIKDVVNSLTDLGQKQLAENTCPLAIIAFLVTDDYESSIRKAISYFIDTDTVACMTGGIAAAYYGVPQQIVNGVADFLPQEIIDILNEFDGINIQNTRTTPKDCHRWGDIIVYGSGDNKNGETEAYHASKYFGAKGALEGMDKRAYAIPTVGRSLDEIKSAVERFCEFAEKHSDMTFLVTKIGLSKKVGYAPKDIAPMFTRVANLPNVYLPIEFRKKW